MAPKFPELVTLQAILVDRSGMYGRRVYLGEWSEVGQEQGRTTLTPNANAWMAQLAGNRCQRYRILQRRHKSSQL
jgi:hypothetical protein